MKKSRYCIGVDLGGTNIAVGIFDLETKKTIACDILTGENTFKILTDNLFVVGYDRRKFFITCKNRVF